NLGLHTRSRGERAAGIAGAIHRLSEDGVGAIVARLQHHIVDLPCRDAKLIHRDRLDILAVGGHDAQLAAGVTPFSRYVYVWPDTSCRSVGSMRIAPHMRRSARVEARPLRRTSAAR